MGRNKNFYYLNKYFISGVRYEALLENHPNLMSEGIVNIIKTYQLDNNINWRFRKFDKEELKGNLQFDLSKVNVGNQENPVWKEVDSKIIGITKQMINEGLTDEEIASKIHLKIVEGGVNMENQKITKNVSVDLGNNNCKVAIDENVFVFVNKVRKERQTNKLADNDYIQLSDDSGYYIISNDEDVFEESQSKKDKNFIPTLYFSICRALTEIGVEAEEVDVNLSMLIPINQAHESAEYISKIKEKDSVLCTYRINKNEDTSIINIKNVEMFLEGVASIPLIENNTGMQSIADIGSKTINVIKVRNSKIVMVDTIDELGSFEYYDKLINKINNRSVNLSNINQLIEDGIYKHDKDLLKAYLKKVLEETNKIIKFDTCVNVNFTGGTIELFKSQGLNFEKGNIKIMNEPIFTNVKGSKVFLDAKYKVGE
ncbi:ParM/StbA family protein [Clostridium estertheticum]|uniref:ParM/StbA family protein n=1 Tax=Clostridium estertheticum TaxID=238834 RepID=UPI00124D4ACC|nr:ParM/StbA family protein [Clostridium estertheticum]MBZ9616771.1 ParM/StbA family protein [Clostridium estertheticum subsp. laramiense]WAG72478.1 ParM/StbA family protein [Clostridium estertheticum]